MKRLIKALSVFAAAALLAPAGNAFAGKPEFKHHRADEDDGDDHDHYQHKGAKAAKIKVGSLTLRSRSLTGKDGMTEVEISTGPFDATAPGNISEVKIRAVDPDEQGESKKDEDHQPFSRKFKNLRQGGYVHWTFPGLPHGQQLHIEAQAKAAVHGDEVEAKLSDVVRYRPDLYVQRIDAPAQARNGVPVQVIATVAEGMGEVGAHYNCALYVDDVRVDGVPDQWMDARAVQSCIMSTSISALGLHTLKVSVENVKPGDYDKSNNSMSWSINIVNPVIIEFSAKASDATRNEYTVTDTYYSNAPGTTPDLHYETTTTTYSQSRTISGSLPLALGVPVPAASGTGTAYRIKRLAFSDRTDGVALGSVEFRDLDLQPLAAPSDPAKYPSESVYSDVTLTGRVISVRRKANDVTKDGVMSFSVSYPAGEIISFSKGFCYNARVDCIPGDYLPIAPQASTVTRFGASYSSEYILEDDKVYSVRPSLTLATTSYPPVVGTPFCQNHRFPGSVGRICTRIDTNCTSKDGQVSGLAPQ
jgi:hypothetical protein